jgi:4-hydroxy-2-oxoheptanedioate aldolase
MKPNPIRQKLSAGEIVMGMMHFTASPMIVEVMASAGLDFFIIDMEHSPIDLGVAAHLVRAADACGLTPFLRVPSVDPCLIKKVLNLGVRGIVIPHATVEDCKAAVAACRYPPEGERGSCPAVRSAGYAQPDWTAHMAQANREIVIIPLIEDKAMLDRIEEILPLRGVDIFFLGPFDLAIALGVPGARFDHPAMAAALERLVGIARRHGKYVMTSVGDLIDHAYGRSLLEKGVSMISYSADALVFQNACRTIAALKRPVQAGERTTSSSSTREQETSHRSKRQSASARLT